MLIITETWFQGESLPFDTAPKGYEAEFKNRKRRRGGGIIAIYNPKTMKVKKIPNAKNYKSFEVLELSLMFPLVTYRLVNHPNPRTMFQYQCFWKSLKNYYRE